MSAIQPTAAQIMQQFGITVEAESLSDRSTVASVIIKEPKNWSVDCRSIADAQKLAFAIAVAIRNYGIL